MASSLFTDSSCLLLVEVQPLLRGVLYRAAKAQSKGEKGRFPFPADCPHLYFCLRSAMRVGTETKHKGQTGNWPKLQGKCRLWCLESQGSVGNTPRSSKNQEPSRSQASAQAASLGYLARLLAGNTTLRRAGGGQWGRAERRDRSPQEQPAHFQPHCALLGAAFPTTVRDSQSHIPVQIKSGHFLYCTRN